MQGLRVRACRVTIEALSTPEQRRPVQDDATAAAVVDAAAGGQSLVLHERPGRRAGQYRAEQAPGVQKALDVWLRDNKSASCDLRRLVTVADQVALLAVVRKYSTSRFAVRLGPSGESGHTTWLLDSDQLAALLGQGWHPGPGDVQGDSWCYALTPGDDASSSKDIRTVLSKLKPYGSFILTAERAAILREVDPDSALTLLARPSQGAESGHPGVEMTDALLEQVRVSLDAPGLAFGDQLVLARKRGSAVGPAVLRLPVTLRRVEQDALAVEVMPDVGDSSVVVGVDAVVRIAVGVAPWEAVQLELPDPRTRRRHVFARFHRAVVNRIAPTVHVVARVQPAELTLAEQNGCLLPPLALDSMGLKSGDVVEVAAADASAPGCMRRHRIKAYEAPKDVLERRKEYHGGDFASLLPDEEGALGLPQALPWIWLDATARRELGLKESFSGVVVRPSRRHVAVDQLRDVAVVLALAFAGAATRLSLDRPGQLLVFALGAIVAPVLLILARVRSRLA